jgi:hypothetical protein
MQRMPKAGSTKTRVFPLDSHNAMAVHSVALLSKYHNAYTSYSIVRCCSVDHKCTYTCSDAAQAVHLLLSCNKGCSNTIAILYGSISSGSLSETGASVLENILSSHCNAIEPAAAEQQACWLASVGAWMLQQQDASADESFSFTPALDAATAAAALASADTIQPLQCQVNSSVAATLAMLCCGSPSNSARRSEQHAAVNPNTSCCPSSVHPCWLPAGLLCC